MIDVKKIKDFPEAVFEVKVLRDTPTTHKVTLREDYYDKLTKGKTTAIELIERSFKFLLDREPNTAILSEFDLNKISTYFPEYEQEISL
jgi:hypothetical protein